MYSFNVSLCFVVFSFNSGKFSAKIPENNTSLIIREFSPYDKNLIEHMLETFNAALYLSPLCFIFLPFAEFWHSSISYSLWEDNPSNIFDDCVFLFLHLFFILSSCFPGCLYLIL